jgi:hypothetical protein
MIVFSAENDRHRPVHDGFVMRRQPFVVADGAAAPGDPGQGRSTTDLRDSTWKACRSLGRLTIWSVSIRRGSGGFSAIPPERFRGGQLGWGPDTVGIPRPWPVLTVPNLRSTVDGMEGAPAEIRRTAAEAPRLTAVSGVPGPALSEVSRAATLPVLPALRELLPHGGLVRGSVVSVAEFGLLALALLAGASADGAWCAIAGVPEAGVLAAAELGLDTERMLLVPDPGDAWPEVVASLFDGCELVLLRPPGQPPAQVRKRLGAALRRRRGVLLVAGDWPGAQLGLRVTARRWTGLGDGHGRLRACLAEVMADGRGPAARPATRWLWLPAKDGSVTAVGPADIPVTGRSSAV